MTPFVTVDEFAGYLQRDVDTYTATVALTGVSGLVREFCGWPITRSETVHRVSGTGASIVSLPTLRLNSLIRVEVDGAELAPDAYTFSTEGQLYRPAGWPAGFANLTVEMDHGYDVTPDAVRLVVCALSARVYSNPEGLAGKSSGDGSRSYMQLSDLEMRLISGHKLN